MYMLIIYVYNSETIITGTEEHPKVSPGRQ